MDVKIALIGMGHVGISFLRLIIEKKSFLQNKFNLSLKLIAIFEFDGALIDENGIDLNELLNKKKKIRDFSNWNNGIKAKEYISKLNVHFIIEATPTNPIDGEPALSHIIESLKKGIDVVSSNKGPFYLEYKKIKNLANSKNCFVKYEATVASCVPALSIKENLMGCEITRIRSILNGTCNYILSRMTSEGIDFSVALKEAQELGYAEADPTLDIDGFDAAGKLVILANELLGFTKSIKEVEIQGIRKITPQAIELAKLDGYVIKHLAIIENEELIVEPRLVEKDSPLNISGTLNVIELETKHAGPIILMGRGAGGLEAASAILNDIIMIAIKRGYIK